MSDCPIDRCPEFLLNNDQCDPRCNIAACDFDNGNCEDNDAGNNDDDGNGQELVQAIFYSVLGIVGLIIVATIVRSLGNTYSSTLGMTPYERVLVLMGIRSREDITGEPDQDNAEGNGGVRADSVEEANAIEEANLLSTQFDNDEAQNLPVADAASQASSNLPEAAEYEEDENEDVPTVSADEDTAPQPNDIVVRNFASEPPTDADL